MDVEKCIKERRSIRRYSDKKVSLSDILDIINCARYAPSSGNLQNWCFIIVKDKKTKSEIVDACLGQDWMHDAPVFIVICSNREKIASYYEKHKNKYSIQNCALAAQNLMLKAHSLGLGRLGA